MNQAKAVTLPPPPPVESESDIDIIEDLDEENIITTTAIIQATSSFTKSNASTYAINTTNGDLNATRIIANENVTSLINTTTSSALKLSSENSKLQQADKNEASASSLSSFFNDYTFKTILTLIAVILFLTSIIMFLVLKNRYFI